MLERLDWTPIEQTLRKSIQVLCLSPSAVCVEVFFVVFPPTPLLNVNRNTVLGETMLSSFDSLLQ